MRYIRTIHGCPVEIDLDDSRLTIATFKDGATKHKLKVSRGKVIIPAAVSRQTSCATGALDHHECELEYGDNSVCCVCFVSDFSQRVLEARQRWRQI